jgi:hypothetical protein
MYPSDYFQTNKAFIEKRIDLLTGTGTGRHSSAFRSMPSDVDRPAEKTI